MALLLSILTESVKKIINKIGIHRYRIERDAQHRIAREANVLDAFPLCSIGAEDKYFFHTYRVHDSIALWTGARHLLSPLSIYIYHTAVLPSRG